jgi:hypothetical protein
MALSWPGLQLDYTFCCHVLFVIAILSFIVLPNIPFASGL